jgi:hypothetical protein
MSHFIMPLFPFKTPTLFNLLLIYPHFGSMLKDPDCSSFEADMQREVSDLLCTETAENTPRSLLPFGLKILQAIWSFHCKRAPD